MKSLAIVLVGLLMSFQIQADEARVMIECKNDQYTFKLNENGYEWYSTATLTRRDEVTQQMSCAEMARRSDNAIWNCLERSTGTEVTIYGDIYKNDVVGEVTLDSNKLATLNCKVNL
jgi:hypothetical protein